MTSILVCSDLHTNFHKDWGKSVISSLKTKNVDIAVIAGDLSTMHILPENIEQLCDIYPEVVFVTGNHEYYGCKSMNELHDVLHECEQKHNNFHFLNQTRKTISGINFIGGTLWFADSPDARAYQNSINDFTYIKDCDPLAFELYDQTVKYLSNNIQNGDVVVTHHLPSYKSVAQQYVGSKLNCYFANHLDELIKNKNPSVWIHGHTHSPCDYTLGNTRVCANPFGYPHENLNFNHSFILNISKA
jgi:Icc-related predicted phosphoesterase